MLRVWSEMKSESTESGEEFGEVTGRITGLALVKDAHTRY